MAEKSSWDQANKRQKHGLVWRNIKKISQIIKAYFYLPFFLLIILCLILSVSVFLYFFSLCSLYTLQCHVSILRFCFFTCFYISPAKRTARLLIHLTLLSYLQDEKFGHPYSFIFVKKIGWDMPRIPSFDLNKSTLGLPSLKANTFKMCLIFPYFVVFF